MTMELRKLALKLAIKSFLSSDHEEEEYEDIMEAMELNDDEALKRLRVITWLPFENYTYDRVAEFIEKQAMVNYTYFLEVREMK
jgi:hypothetical protein